MQNTKTKVPFTGTEAQESELTHYISDMLEEKGCLMPILQKAQEIYGYLPIEVQIIIARGLRIPIEEVYSTATFYSQFTLNPKGEHQISVCLGTACYVKGSGAIFDRLAQVLGIGNGELTPDGKFSLDSCRCIGACGLAPVMMIDEDVYGRVTIAQIDKIIEKYK